MLPPLPTFACVGLVALAALLARPGAAQSALDCLPPVPPRPVTDLALMSEYREEIGAEYTAYFDDAQAYLRCLEVARAAVTEEINQVIRDYQVIGQSGLD